MIKLDRMVLFEADFQEIEKMFQFVAYRSPRVSSTQEAEARRPGGSGSSPATQQVWSQPGRCEIFVSKKEKEGRKEGGNERLAALESMSGA